MDKYELETNDDATGEGVDKSALDIGVAHVGEDTAAEDDDGKMGTGRVFAADEDFNSIAMFFSKKALSNDSWCLFFKILTNDLLTLKKSRCGAVNPVTCLNLSATSFWISMSGLNLLFS